MGLDFYGTQISARIIVPQKSGGQPISYDLWINGGATGVSAQKLPKGLQDLSYVQDVSIEIGLNLNSKVTVTMNMPLEEGIDLIHSELLSWAASQLRVQIGYSSGDHRLSMEFGGLMMKPGVRIGQDVTITLTGLGVAYGLNLSNATAQDYFPPPSSPWDAVKKVLQGNPNINIGSDSEVFPDFTPDQMDKTNPNAHPFFRSVVGKKASTPTDQANASAQKAKIGLQVISGKITAAQGEEQSQLIDQNLRTQDQLTGISRGARNDWWFIRELVKQYHLAIIVTDNNVTIRDPAKWRMGTPKYQFVLKGNIDTDNNVFPILEFDSPSTYVWLGAGIGGTLISDVIHDTKHRAESWFWTTVDPTKQINPNTATITETQNAPSSSPPALSTSVLASAIDQYSKKIDVPRTGQGAYVPPTGADTYSAYPGTPEDQRADAAESELKNYNNDRGLQCEITTLGIPELLPADIAEIKGLASHNYTKPRAWFDGLYGIMMVQHSIGTGGMFTKFKGCKNFFPGQTIYGTDDPTQVGTVNNSSAPASSGPGQTSNGTTAVNPSGD